MKKTVLFLVLGLLVSTSAFAMGGFPGSKPGTCEAKSWNCNAFWNCKNNVTHELDKQCAQKYVTDCMGDCDAEKYFPQYWD